MPDYVPALQARMGDWLYYVTVMKLGKIARECRLADEIHPNKDLDALIQRAIQDRVQKEMVPYLLSEPQRFYGALVGLEENGPEVSMYFSVLGETGIHRACEGDWRFYPPTEQGVLSV